MHIYHIMAKGAQDPIVFPQGLVKVVFDNCRKVGKTYAITGTNIVPTSEITSSLWMILNKESEMQNTHIFKPSEWVWKTIDSNSKEKLIKSLTEPSDEFRKITDVFIKSCIKIVFNQHTTSSRRQQ